MDNTSQPFTKSQMELYNILCRRYELQQGIAEKIVNDVALIEGGRQEVINQIREKQKRQEGIIDSIKNAKEFPVSKVIEDGEEMKTLIAEIERLQNILK